MAKKTVQIADKQSVDDLLTEVETLKTELANLKETSSGEWTLLGSGNLSSRTDYTIPESAKYIRIVQYYTSASQTSTTVNFDAKDIDLALLESLKSTVARYIRLNHSNGYMCHVITFRDDYKPKKIYNTTELPGYFKYFYR